MGFKASWKRTGAIMVVRSHLVEVNGHRIKVEWPDALLIRCAAVMRDLDTWGWSIVQHGAVIDKGTSGSEIGARSSVRRRLKGLVHETRKRPEVYAREQAELEARKLGASHEREVSF